MKFANPFDFLPVKQHKSTILILGFITLLTLVILTVINVPLKNDVSPLGIISFELANDLYRSISILSSWESDHKLYAAFSLGLDYFFIIFYSLFLSLSCFALSDKLELTYWAIRMTNAGTFFGWLPIIAGTFDLIENYSLIRLLLGTHNETFSSMAQMFGLSKYILISFSIIYILVGLITLAYLQKKIKNK